MEQEDQSSILDVLADYFDDDCSNNHDDKGNYIRNTQKQIEQGD